MTLHRDIPVSHGPAAISILDVLRGVGRRKLFILGMTVIAFGVGFGLVKVLKPAYTTEAQVLIQNLETPFDRFQPADNQRNNTVDDRVVASQISVIQSQDLGRRVIAALSLESNPEFNPLIKGVGLAGRLKVMLGFATDPRLKTPEQRALEHYDDKLNVFQLPESNVIGIKYTSANPDVAAKVANTLAETYVMWTRESQSVPTERARDWLSQQIEALRHKLAQSEEEVEKFRAAAGLLQGTTTTLGAQEISELNTQITVARTASLEARAKADAIRDLLASRGSVDTATDVLASAVVQRLKEQRTEAVRRMAELSVTYLDNHPKMVAARAEIANIDRQIRAEALKIVSSLDEQARVAESRQKSLEASLEKLKTQESTANLDDVKLKALERNAAADRALLETMMSRYAEASSRQDLTSQPGLGVIIQSASVPASPSFPKPGPMVLLITLAGLSFGLGLAFLMELMSAAARQTEGAVARDLPEPALTISETPKMAQEAKAPEAPVLPVPAANSPTAAPAAAPVSEPAPAPDAPPVSSPRTPVPAASITSHLTVWPKIIPQGDMSGITDVAEVAAAAQKMSQWIAGIDRNLDVRRIGITSVGGGTADAPVAALALARTLSQTRKRVVLVDIARMGAFLGGLCGVAQGPGLSDLVSGATEFTKVIARDTRSTTHVLRFGLDHSENAAVLIHERLSAVLDALAQTYDYCVVNLGEAIEETPVYLHKCDAALVMAPSSRLTEASDAVETLLSTGLKTAHLVLIGQPVRGADATGNVHQMTATG